MITGIFLRYSIFFKDKIARRIESENIDIHGNEISLRIG